jgi:hypothetical protein
MVKAEVNDFKSDHFQYGCEYNLILFWTCNLCRDVNMSHALIIYHGNIMSSGINGN